MVGMQNSPLVKLHRKQLIAAHVRTKSIDCLSSIPRLSSSENRAWEWDVQWLSTFLKASVRICVEMGDHFHRGLLLFPSTLGLSRTALRLPSALCSSEVCVCAHVGCVFTKERHCCHLLMRLFLLSETGELKPMVAITTNLTVKWDRQRIRTKPQLQEKLSGLRQMECIVGQAWVSCMK